MADFFLAYNLIFYGLIFLLKNTVFDKRLISKRANIVISVGGME